MRRARHTDARLHMEELGQDEFTEGLKDMNYCGGFCILKSILIMYALLSLKRPPCMKEINKDKRMFPEPPFRHCLKNKDHMIQCSKSIILMKY